MDNARICTLLEHASELMVMKQADATGSRSPYICDNIAEAALDFSGPDYKAYVSASQEITSVIHERLGDCWSIWQWLAMNGYIRDDQKYSGEVYEQVQLYRQRWIAALIVEFAPGVDTEAI